MELWTVYERPERSPGAAVRKVLVEDDGLAAADEQVFASLIEARSALARRGLIRVPRAAQDDPALIETWI